MVIATSRLYRKNAMDDKLMNATHQGQHAMSIVDGISTVTVVMVIPWSFLQCYGDVWKTGGGFESNNKK